MEVSDQRLLKIVNEFERLSEKVAILNGERGTTGKAVTGAALSPLTNIPTSLNAKELTVAPTAADFNALLKDVKNIQAQLNSIALTIGNGA